MNNVNLTEKQLEASKHFKGTALTLAVPGSGKTTLLLHRINYLIEVCGVDPKSILTLTFSKASADDMSQRFATIATSNKSLFMTIHKFSYKIVMSYFKSIGRPIVLLDDTNIEKRKMIQSIYKKYNPEYLTDEVYDDILSDIGLINNLMIDENDENFNKSKLKTDYSFKISRDFKAAKKAKNYIDFDDMILIAIKVLEKNPKALEFYQNLYQYVQVDEAQDTSKLQFELINLISLPTNNLFLVADDDQSIYGFRGAYPEYLLNFKNFYPEGSIYYIEHNFRSTESITSKCSKLIKNNMSRFDKEMIPTRDKGGDVKVICFDDQYNRNKHILEYIANKPSSETVGILFRNKISAITVIDMLEINNIDFYIKDVPKALNNHWIYKDIMAFFNLALVEEDLDSFCQISYKMNAYISREMVSYVKENIRMKSVFNTLISIPFLEDYQVRTQEITYNTFLDIKKHTPSYGVQLIEIELGYLEYLKKLSTRTGLGMQPLRNHIEIVKTIAEQFYTPYELISRLEYLRDYFKSIRKNSVSKENITLSTIHSSKGLEFDTVFLIDINSNVFPPKKSVDASDDGDFTLLEEERRLMYVGMSRARTKLEILHCNLINGVSNKKSLFIDEIL